MSHILQAIVKETQQIIEQKGEQCPEINESSEFLKDLPMDSLDLATLIVSLEMNTGIDPFSSGFKTFYTVRELVDLYEEVSN